MRYALSVPNFGDFADPNVTIGLARDAEAAGWDAYFLWDHVLARNGNGWPTHGRCWRRSPSRPSGSDSGRW